MLKIGGGITTYTSSDTNCNYLIMYVMIIFIKVPVLVDLPGKRWVTARLNTVVLSTALFRCNIYLAFSTALDKLRNEHAG